MQARAVSAPIARHRARIFNVIFKRPHEYYVNIILQYTSNNYFVSKIKETSL